MKLSLVPDQFFHDEGLYHRKTSPLICRANQWTGFYMTGTSVMKNLLILAKWQLITLADILTNFTEIPFNDFIIFLLPLGLRMTDRT